jgi:hypothetical protein
LALSFCKSTHEPLQAFNPGRQLDAQPPPVQTAGAAHLTPQPPQLFGSTLVGMHWPPQRA